MVIASATDPAYAMPAAGWAAESGDPVLFVNGAGDPVGHPPGAAGPPEPAHLRARPAERDPRRDRSSSCGKYGTVKRVGGADPAANSVAFAIYRDPACTYGQPCAHVPGSFGWAMRSPGHGYVLLNASRPLDAAAAAAAVGQRRLWSRAAGRQSL